jgi:phospholipid-binding lipoprotein MlaA
MSAYRRVKIIGWFRFELIAAALAPAILAGPALADSGPGSEAPASPPPSSVSKILQEPPASTPVEDPLEPVNRRLFAVDLWVNKTLAGKGRILFNSKWIPHPVRHGLYNMFDNLEEPGTVANDLMQTKFKQGAEAAGRFAVNSTVGVFGVFDPATKMHMERTREDFGQTLAIWGITAGPYVYIPISGPTTVRDSLGGIVDGLFLPNHWLPMTIWETQGANLVHYVVKPSTIGIRQVARGAAEAGATHDEYATLRQLYYDQRADQIADRPNLADDPVPEIPEP